MEKRKELIDELRRISNQLSDLALDIDILRDRIEGKEF